MAPFTGDPGTLKAIKGLGGETIEGDLFVIACGGWMLQMLPQVLKDRIFASRQGNLLFPYARGRPDLRVPRLPERWGELGQEDNNFYGFPTVEGRGFKIANGLRGGPIDIDAS